MVQKSKKTEKAEKKAKKPDPRKTERQIVYAEPAVENCVGEKALTAERAKVLLGWEAEEGDVKFGQDYQLVDLEGRKIRLYNNMKNRPLYLSNVHNLKQEMLMKRWKWNTETIGVGATGQIVNGQHRLIAIVFAEQERTSEAHKFRWMEYWDGPVSIETVIAFGSPEDDETVNTIDTGKSRSLPDVIYRSDYFAKLKDADRKPASRMLAIATTTLWDRTGAAGSAGSLLRRTHTESLKFIERHPRLLKAVGRIYELDGTRSITHYVGSAGAAVACLYLMGASSTDGDVYWNADPPSEKKISWDNWEEAERFWELFSQGDKAVDAVRAKIADLSDPENEGQFSTPAIQAVLAFAWAAFKENGRVAKDDLTLQFHKDADGFYELKSYPDFGGIDKGPGKPKAADEPEVPPTEEEIEAAKLEIDAGKARRAPKVQKLMETRANGSTRAPDEVKPPSKVPLDKDGKPPAPKVVKPKRVTRAQVEADQTARAAAADAEMAKVASEADDSE